MKELEVIIKGLIGLQDCDVQVKDIRSKKEEGPDKIKALEDELKHMEEQVEEELGQRDAYKGERRQIEQDIEELESKIEKSKVKLSNIKSNKEYEAALKEIDELEREKALSEDSVIEIMEEVESLEGKCAVSKARMDEFKKRLREDKREIQEELEALDRNLENREKERVRIRKEINEDLLKKYDSIIEHKGGVAISPVIKGVCQACHMGIPPQKFNELMRGNELMSCPHCTRIIYWGEDERFQKAVGEG